MKGFATGILALFALAILVPSVTHAEGAFIFVAVVSVR